MFVLKRLCALAGFYATLSVAVVAQPAPTYVALAPQPSMTSEAWGMRGQGCVDGQMAPFLHSLVRGEQAVGAIISKPFAAPDKLSFWVAGASHQKKNFVYLIDAATSQVLRTEAPPESDTGQQRSWDLKDLAGRQVRLRLVDEDTGDGWAWLAVGRIEPAVVALAGADGTLPEGWSIEQMKSAPLNNGGIPFLPQSGLWNLEHEGDSVDLPCAVGGAKSVYLMGALNTIDNANPGWGGGDSTVNFFIGDSIGTLRVKYQSGRTDEIPLVYGYTVWWSEAYKRTHVPFSENGPERELLDRALCVANGLDGYRGDAAPYYICVRLREEPLASIGLADRAEKKGHFVLKAVTLELGKPLERTQADFKPLTSDGPTSATRQWLAKHTVDAANPYPAEEQEAIKQLAHRFYTTPADVTEEAIAAVKPDVTAENFAGPKVRFAGPPEATLMTNIYYENAANMLSRVDPDGMVHESAKGSTNFSEFGPWIPGMGPFYGDFYTRIRALMLLTEMGFTGQAQSAIDFSDKWMMYYPKEFPKIQLGGKPVPGHASVICNMPHVYWDLSRNAGWPTKQKSRDMGNAETDGHGLLMLTKWRQWNQLGRPVEWVNAHWEAINEAAEFIPWQLDNPELSFSEHGLLYSESEGGMATESLYANTACYFGLLGHIEMAKAAGKTEKATRWQAQAERLQKAMDAWFPTQDPKYGDVWDPAKSAGWGYDQGVLAPILFSTDFWGYDGVNKLPAGWLERTKRSYEMIVKEKLKPAWCAPAGLGYGQNYFCQSALLLDRMDESTKTVNWLARFCYAPRMEHPYRSPEGITMAEDGSVWRRWGDLGNLYQMAEAVYTIQTMLGIDDFGGKELKLMPRLPDGWTEMEVKDWPVRVMTADGKSSQTVKLAYHLTRSKDSNKQKMVIETEAPVGSIAVRLGPLDHNMHRKVAAVKVTVNGQRVGADLLDSGTHDQWAWIKLDGKQGKRFEIEAHSAYRGPDGSIENE